MQLAPKRPKPSDPEEFGKVLQFPRRPGKSPVSAPGAGHDDIYAQVEARAKAHAEAHLNVGLKAAHARPRGRAYNLDPVLDHDNPEESTAAELPDDLARYEQEPDEPVDYRQRMLMNVMAALIVTLLVGIGIWIADTVAGMEKDQDCLLQGRGNCAPIGAPARLKD